MKTVFIRYFKDEEVCEDQLSVLILEIYIDYNKFKEIKSFTKKNKISEEEYDKIISRAVEKQLRQSRNIDQMDDFIRKIFDLFGDIQRQYNASK